MWTEVASNVIALALGLLLGFYFERRSARVAREESRAAEERIRELREQLARAHLELIGVGVGVEDSVARAARPDAVDAALVYTRDYQDAYGRTRSSVVRDGLVGLGYGVGEADAAIELLVAASRVRRVGMELEVVE